MAFDFVNLDSVTREFMAAESNLGGHYRSPRLNQTGINHWIPFLNSAIADYQEVWLAGQLALHSCFNFLEPYVRSGKTHSRAINGQFAGEQLAEGEFNRYYIRGLCRRALESNKPNLVVCRGKSVSRPRPESEAKIGSLVDAGRLLDALRSNNFVSIEDSLAIPGGPSSGITVRLP